MPYLAEQVISDADLTRVLDREAQVCDLLKSAPARMVEDKPAQAALF